MWYEPLVLLAGSCAVKAFATFRLGQRDCERPVSDNSGYSEPNLIGPVAVCERIMSAIVIEHVNVADLPESWRAKLPEAVAEHVTVRIETEALAMKPDSGGFVTDDPAFGIWRDREDMADVETYLRKVRAPRYNRDGSRNEG